MRIIETGDLEKKQSFLYEIEIKRCAACQCVFEFSMAYDIFRTTRMIADASRIVCTEEWRIVHCPWCPHVIMIDQIAEPSLWDSRDQK